MNNDAKKFLIDLIIGIIEKDAQRLEKFGLYEKVIEKAQKCMKHIKCLVCFDTSRVILISDGFLYGVFYDEYTCSLCNNGKTDYIKRHHNLEDAVDKMTGRKIPCHEQNLKYNSFSHILTLSKIYEDKYEVVDNVIKEVERKELELDQKLIEIKDREYKVKLEEARIRNERNALNLEKIPKWSSQKFDVIEREIHSVNVKVDIKNLVEDVMKCVAIAAGNLAAIPSLISGLDASLNLCWNNSRNTSYYSDIIEDEKGQKIYVRFDYKKINEDNKGDIKVFRFFWEDKKEYLCVNYLVLKPINAAAECKCIEMMNSDFDNIQKLFKK